MPGDVVTIGAVGLAVKALLGDFRKDFASEAKRAATEGGDAASTAFTAAFRKNAGKAVAAGLVGVFAIASKGALDLDSAARKAAAGMGLAEDELAAFRSEVNELSKANPTKTFTEIADTAAAVRTEMGLTGEALTIQTQRMLDWTKVAGGDGVNATRDLDRALDAYNLTAEDGARIQDALVGAQRLGAGPAAENLRILGELAPALQAANLGWEDGVGFLIETGAAGIDASTGVNALRTALTKVKSPEELQRMIEDIRTTESDFDRTSKAAELFGTRAGVKMAALLKPGSDALSGTTASMDQFTGAVARGADLVDESLGNRITSAIRNFVSGPLAELGANAPGVLAAAAGLSAIGGAVRGFGGVLDSVAATAGIRWAAILGPLALVGGGVGIVVALESFKNPINDFLTGLAGIKDSMDRVIGGFGRFGQAARPAIVETSQTVRDGARAWTDYERDATEAARGIERETARSLAAAEGATDELIEGMAALPFEMQPVLRDWSSAMEFIPAATYDQVPPTLDAALAIALAVRDGIEAGRSDIVDAYGNLQHDQATALTRMQEIGLLGSVLASKAVRDGLASEDPSILANTNALVLSIAKRLDALGPGAYQAGVKAAQSFLAGFSNTSADFQEANMGAAHVARQTVAGATGAGLVAGLLGDIVGAGAVVKPFTGDVKDLAAALGLSESAASGAGKATGSKAKADKEASAAAREHADAAKGKLTDALRSAKDAALDYFKRVHDARLQSIRDSAEQTRREIDDARRRIRSNLDEKRSRIDAGVDAAEDAQQQIEDARTLRDLQESLTEARGSGDLRAIRSAEESLQSFRARADIAAMRAAARTAIDVAEEEARQAEAELDKRQTEEEAKTAILIKAEQDRFEEERKAFDKRFAALSADLQAGKMKHAEVNAEVESLYKAFGVTMEEVGREAGTKYAAGLLASKQGVIDAASELAQVVSDHLKTSSPARTGPLSRTSPEEMGARIGGGLRTGLRRQLLGVAADLAGVLRLPSLIAAPTLAFDAARGGRGGQVAGGTTVNIRIDNPTPERAFESSERSLRYVAAGLFG